MGKYVVAIMIDKVQTFIYDVLQGYIQENQANSGTLREIILSSELISKNFYEDIGVEGEKGEFSGHIIEPLLACSGMCVFSTTLNKEQILERVDRLFNKYYMQSNGKLLIKHVCFEKDTHRNDAKLEAIKKSKLELRSSYCLNEIISRHQHILFEFHPVHSNGSIKGSIATSADYPHFSENINALYTEEAANRNHFRIAVIKADLDGMGDLFKSIGRYPVYEAVSSILNENISLSQLHKQVEEYKKINDNFKLYPLYMAGDDIFFAVPVHQLLDGINICKNILNHINNKIVKLKCSHHADVPALTMSVGVDITFNREPIRYYYERVQHQLECAKAVSSVDKKICMKISINEHVFMDSSDSDQKTTWSYFRDDIMHLQGAMQHGFAAHHFLYGLLNKIPDRSTGDHDLKFSNSVLYHLLPKHMDSSEKLREYELVIISSLIHKLSDKRKGINELRFNEKNRIRLRKHIQLLLLFTAERFGITGSNEDRPPLTFKKNDVQRAVFNRTMRYLYNHSLILSSDNNEKFRNIFIELTSYEVEGKKHSIHVYRCLRITSSMFHRLKRMSQFPDHIKIAANMIQAANPLDQDKKQETESTKIKAPTRLSFDKDVFIRLSKHIWTEDYIDALLIFYRYRELSIQYKTIYRSSNNRPSGGVNQ